MYPENAIEVKNVTKSFRIYKDKSNSLKDKVLFKERNRYEARAVLKGISFNIKKGEAVGLIGHNGCGKSTTLKLLTQIIYPDSGTIKISGRVSSLLELGAGFHPDMSGRDNIYINASIFGLTKREIDERVNDIIDFSELGDYIDSPVRTYSSGMYMRLAFSVAINVNADVLLIDEILAVGDANFQEKCTKELQKIKKQGTTIIIVSHSLGQIESICDRSIWLNDGVIAEDNSPAYVHRRYLEFMEDYSFKNENTRFVREEEKPEDQPTRKGNGKIRIEKVICCDANKERKNAFDMEEDVSVVVSYKVIEPEEVNIFVGISRIDYLLCYSVDYWEEKGSYIKLKEDGEIVINFPDIQLLPSKYMVDIRIFDKEGNDIDVYNEAAEFYTCSQKHENGLFRMNHTWVIAGKTLISDNAGIK